MRWSRELQCACTHRVKTSSIPSTQAPPSSDRHEKEQRRGGRRSKESCSTKWVGTINQREKMTKQYRQAHVKGRRKSRRSGLQFHHADKNEDPQTDTESAYTSLPFLPPALHTPFLFFSISPVEFSPSAGRVVRLKGSSLYSLTH
mmetsp:Transcript_46217/g.91106  ORF Transcript_46217/g.91106 Transcript_46217/m.91106 type:complete len:145 (+) Transcript_46217:1115-1549(+)